MSRGRATRHHHRTRGHDPVAWEAYLTGFPWSLYVTFTLVLDAVSLGTAFGHFTTAVRTLARERTGEHVRIPLSSLTGAGSPGDGERGGPAPGDGQDERGSETALGLPQ